MGVEEATKFICELRFKQTGKDLWISVCEYVENLKNNSKWKCRIQRSWKIKITTNNGISSSKDSESDERGKGISQVAKLQDSGCTCMRLLLSNSDLYILWKFRGSLSPHTMESIHQVIFPCISCTSGRQKIKVYSTAVWLTPKLPYAHTAGQPVLSQTYSQICITNSGHFCTNT
jgi:hypothetical protein